MKLFALLCPIITRGKYVHMGTRYFYSPKAYTGDEDEWGWSVVNSYTATSHVMVF